MRPLDALEAQRGHLFPWVPVALAFGIGGYFALRIEPGGVIYAALAAVGLLSLVLARWGGERAAPVFLLMFLAVLGVGLAGARAHMVGAPVLKFRYYGAVEGRIIAVDRSLSDVPRLTLDRVWLDRMPAAKIPEKIRVSLHGPQDQLQPQPGQTVILTANLSPPSAPSEPGGFDFQRRAWFDGLGAVGYTRTPVLLWAPADEGRAGLLVHRSRMALSQAIRDRVPGDAGAFAAAILTGDRSAMSRDTLQTLRDSNLAHLLAISGLHMGLLTGFIFAGVRYGLALIPPVALRLPTKKIAAVVALMAGAVYLALSGGNIATQRAFIMVAVMFVAVLFDRRAITLRAVALAAVIVLVMEPESLTEPGFQMSFAATTALVAVFGALRDWPEEWWQAPRWARPILAVVISSAVAGAATAPVGAAHFNQIAQFGLLANLITVPLMGLLVIPAAVLAACLSPFGLAFIGLEVMRWGILWILGVAAWVAGLEGAVWPVVTPVAPVLPVLALGMLWLFLWQGRVRFAGVLPVLAGLAMWGMTERPALLISEGGGLVGVLTPEGRAMNKPRGEGFVARSWLENDGDRALQDQAFARAGFDGARGALRVQVAGAAFLHISGRGWADKIADGCTAGWVIVPQKVADAPPGCQLLDRIKLAQTGAIAVYPGDAGPRLIGAKTLSGPRLWTQ